MIDKFCDYLTNKMKKKMPDIDDDKAEVIKYGLQLLLGEFPKIFIMLMIAWALGILKITLLCFVLILPYRMYSGGFHLKTHIGCILGTSLMYAGNAYISQFLKMSFEYKIVLGICLLIFAISMILKYAPADTEDVPVISKKERKKRKIISLILAIIMIIVGCLIKNNLISNMLLVGVLIQTISITRFAYKITNNKYGHEEYWKNKNAVVN